MNVENARGGLAALNVTLTAGLVFLGWFTFVKHHEPSAGDRVPNYLPTKLQLPLNTNKGDPLREFNVVWSALDKAPDPPAPPKPVEKPAVPDDLTAKFKLLMVAIDSADPRLNNCIIQKKDVADNAPDAQQAFRVGENLFDPFKAFKVVKVEAKEGTKGRVAVVTLEDTQKTQKDGSHPVTTIQLTPDEK